MVRADLTDEQYDRLVNAIFKVLVENGPSHTSMDLLARKFSMSKRTLYELFGSKDEMITETMEYIQQCHAKQIKELISECTNVMESMATAIIYLQKTMGKLSAKFFRDFDDKYSHLRCQFDNESKCWIEDMQKGIQIGIQQGVFRTDPNYDVMIPLLRVQMESLIRLENVIPSDFSVKDAYRTIGLGFLRGIATEKGMRILEGLTPKFYEDN